MTTVVLPLSAFVIRISGLLFRKVRVDFMSWIIFFCQLVMGFFVCLRREKVVMQFKNFNLAAFLSSSLIFWILDSKSATNCFMGNWLLGMGVPKFLPRLTVLATEGGMWMSVRLVNQEWVVMIGMITAIFCHNMAFADETLKFGFTTIFVRYENFLCFYRFWVEEPVVSNIVAFFKIFKINK